jgi:hypothetical protein
MTISRLASTISLFPVVLAFLPAFVFSRRFHPDSAQLLLLRVMSLVSNVTASHRRLTLLTPFRERL